MEWLGMRKVGISKTGWVQTIALVQGDRWVPPASLLAPPRRHCATTVQPKYCQTSRRRPPIPPPTQLYTVYVYFRAANSPVFGRGLGGWFLTCHQRPNPSLRRKK